MPRLSKKTLSTSQLGTPLGVTMKLDFEVSCPVSSSPRARQLEGLFDVPRAEKSVRRWTGDVPIEDKPWNVGLIVGPSGAGKTTVAGKMFGVDEPLKWGQPSVVDDFAKGLTMKQIADACGSVGFNTIPAWMRPYSVLSTGEKFRVELARRLLEAPTDRPLVVDEFTSVVDRQVAQIGSHAVQKWVRRNDRQFVAVSCHHDIVSWLQPDWVLEPATMSLTWRSLQPRPPLDIVVSQIPRTVWPIFAPYHYMSADINRSAKCFGLWVGDNLASFLAVLHRVQPTSQGKSIKAAHRAVTLPDWQGLGLAFVLHDTVGSCLKAKGWRFRTPPAHPSFVRSFDRSPNWSLKQKPGGALVAKNKRAYAPKWRPNSRPNAIFEYCGPAANKAEADRLFSGLGW